MAKAKEQAKSSPQIDETNLKRKGTITPEELMAWMVIVGFPKTPQILAEGAGVVFAESGFNCEITSDNVHYGLWQEEESFGSVEQRTDAKEATAAALRRWKADGNTFDGAWSPYDGDAAHVNAPKYLATAESVVTKGVTGKGGAESTAEETGGGLASGGVSLEAVENTAKAAAFSTFIELPGIEEQEESMALKGGRSLMNDKPLMGFIEQLTQGTLRRFQSLPNGNFYAFYPDYFGGMKQRTPYWEIYDIEVLEGEIQLTDDALATHVYVVGDNTGYLNGIDLFDKVSASGVVTLFQAMAMHFITGLEEGPELADKSKAEKQQTKDQVINFLKKYGARPYYEEAPMVRSGYYEMFLAYQRFCLLWASQFEATFQVTFMPEIFPGGLIAFPEHGIQMFVEEVSHNMDFETGFTTTIKFSAPAALKNGPNGVHDGMIRANALT